MPFLRSFVFVKFLCLLFAGFWLLNIHFSAEVPADTGDGILHFFYSQASWQNPQLFLHHWGKPLFILLSSPFSQFGFTGLVLFNLLVFLLTCFIGFKILEQWKVPELLQALLPLLLLIPNDSTITIIGGLTEPLFNLFIVVALYVLLKQKFIYFALIVSCLPFLRSEGQLGIVIALFILAAIKEFKAIPFLITGFLIYSVAGIFVYSDFLWYFTKSPYHMSDDIYGQGNWYHYFIYYKNYIGLSGLILFLISLISVCVLISRKNWDALKWKELLFSYGIFFGILFAHVYFWANGKNGSIGLTRVATQGLPAFIILNLYFTSVLLHKKNRVLAGFSVAGIIALANIIWSNQSFPIKANPLERSIFQAAEYIRNNKDSNQQVFYEYPLFAFAYGDNPEFNFTNDRNLINKGPESAKPGDFVIRDSHFGPNKKGLSLVEINKNPELVLIAEFISSEQINDEKGETEGVKIYQKIPKDEQIKVKNSKRKIELNKVITIRKNEEFTNIDPVLSKDFQNNTQITLKLISLEGTVKLSYDHNNLEVYTIVDVLPKKEINMTFDFKKGGKTKLYFWNPNKSEAKILLKEIILEERILHPVYHPR